LVEALSSSTSASTPDPDSSDDYPEIGAIVYGEMVKAMEDEKARVRNNGTQ
jgi:hypothetical protein